MKIRKTINITKETHKKLKEVANEKGMMICILLEQIIKEYFKNKIDLTK